jgi:hypothetical protein
MSALANKLSNLKNKSVVLEVKDVKYPDNIADPLALFEKNSSPKTASANDWTVDVFPSQIPIFMFIMQLAASASAAADHKNQAKSSLATFVLYYAVCLQGFFLLNDLHVRPTPSAHAASWSTISWKNAFAEYLLSLPVPDSMKTIFAQLAATETNRTKNVFFVPSAAGFHLHHFFGRFVPINFFSSLHDCIATMPGNSKPSDIQQDFLSRTLFKFVANYIPNKTFVSCADILGIHTDGTSATYATGKWYQVFSSVFNPVLFRDFHRRSSLATLDLQTPNFKKTASINAYDILFSATPYNLSELKTVLDHLQPIIKSVVPMSKSLSQVISEASGINILQHGYSTYALPTWIANPDSANKTFLSGTGKLKSEDYDSRSTVLTFLKSGPTRPTGRDITVGTLLGTTPTFNTLTWPWSLISTSDVPTHPYPEDSRFVSFDDEVHPTPRVLVLDVLGSESVAAHLATLCGMIIESFELDATTIEHPNVDKSLAAQNSLFADSAIPYKYVVRATRFYPRTTTELPPVLARHLVKPSTSQPAASLLHSRTAVHLPEIKKLANKATGTGHILDPTSTTGIPGMTKISSANWLKYCQSFLGLLTLNPNSQDDADNVPEMELGRLYLWSPYTYTPVYDSDCSDLVPDLSLNRSYFLSNLRSIFGTDTNLVEVVHPFVAMPV